LAARFGFFWATAHSPRSCVALAFGGSWRPALGVTDALIQRLYSPEIAYGTGQQSPVNFVHRAQTEGAMETFLVRFVLICAFATWSSSSIAAECGKTKPEITVVYMSAKDCTWCRYWESGLSGMKSGFEKSPEFKKINFLQVKRVRIDTPPSNADYPEELAWLRDRIEQEPRYLALGTPSWIVFVDKARVARYWGTQTWNDKIFPDIKRIVNASCPS